MKAPVLMFCCLVAASAAWAQAGGQGYDPNAMPQGPVGTVRADTQGDAQAAYERARADCRGVDRRKRRDCLDRAQQQYDREQRQKPAPHLSRPALTPQ